MAAIRAVIDLGTVQYIADVRVALLAGDSEVNREWLAELLDGLVLDSHWLPWLLKALERTAKTKRYSGRDTLAVKLSSLVADCPLTDLPALIADFGNLFDKPPTTDQGFSTISKRYSWLAEVAGLAVLRLLQARHPFTFDESSLVSVRPSHLARPAKPRHGVHLLQSLDGAVALPRGRAVPIENNWAENQIRP